MKCPNCNATINKMSNFCSHCGISLAKNQETVKNEDYDIDELTDIFIRENKEKIKKCGFSVPALVFGPFYYYYRKMYLEATFILILRILIAIFAGSRTIPLNICISIYMGLTFNRHYLKHVREEIDKLIKIFKDKSTLLMQAYQKGGTNTTPIAVLGSIYFLSVIGIFTYLVISDEEFYQLEYTETNDSQYEDLYYVIPKGFKKNDISTAYYELYEAETNSCSFSISRKNKANNSTKNSTNPSIDRLALSQSSEEKTVINNFTWYIKEKDDKTNKTYELKYKGEHLDYNISYFYLKDDSQTFCEDAFIKLKESLRIEP